MKTFPLTAARKQQQERRLQAIPLFKSGIHQAEVARRLGVSREAVRHWWNAWQEGSKLKATKAPGRPMKVGHEVGVEIIEVVKENLTMTARALRDFIWAEFHEYYSVDHMRRMKRSVGRKK